MADKPLEEQIHEKLCKDILDALEPNSANWAPGNARTFAEIYEIMFGKYEPQELVDQSKPSPLYRPKNFRG